MNFLKDMDFFKNINHNIIYVVIIGIILCIISYYVIQYVNSQSLMEGLDNTKTLEPADYSEIASNLSKYNDEMRPHNLSANKNPLNNIIATIQDNICIELTNRIVKYASALSDPKKKKKYSVFVSPFYEIILLKFFTEALDIASDCVNTEINFKSGGGGGGGGGVW